MAAGIAWVAAILLGLLAAIVASDLVFEILGWTPIGYRVQHWAREYPLFSLALMLLFGAFLGHFFWN